MGKQGRNSYIYEHTYVALKPNYSCILLLVLSKKEELEHIWEDSHTVLN